MKRIIKDCTILESLNALKKEIDIERELCPTKDILEIEDGVGTIKIVDAELDIIKCTVIGDECVEIDTSNYTYITLTYDNLERLMDAIIESENL